MGYLGVPPQSGFITTAKQRVTSSTNNYVDLDHSISSIADVIVFVNFVKQDTTNLTLTTSTRITLGDTLVSSDIVEIHYLGKAVNTQTPATGTVTNDMLAGSIANSKLANSSITLNGSAVSLGGSATISSDDNAPAFYSYVGTLNNVANNTSTIIPASSEVFDSDGKYDTSTYRFTPGVTGKYAFYVQTRTNQTDARIQVALYKNGSNASQSNGHIEMENVGHGNNTYVGVNGFTIATCDSTSDYFQGVVWHKSGSTETFYNNYFMGFKLAGIS